MIRRIGIVALALILAGCGGAPMKRTFDRDLVEVRVVWVDRNQVAGVCAQIRHERPSMLRHYGGCAQWSAGGPPYLCTIYTAEPADLNDARGLETLGHEFFHCLRGHFHD